MFALTEPVWCHRGFGIRLSAGVGWKIWREREKERERRREGGKHAGSLFTDSCRLVGDPVRVS